MLRIDDSIKAMLGDLLLFCGNCINVLGVEPMLFKTIVSTHWESLTKQQKHAGKYKVCVISDRDSVSIG